MNFVNHMEKKQLVLVVDDYPQVLRFIEIDLKHHGFEVITATSGEEALRLIKARDPNIMLLDIIMPGMDGLEVLRQLRSFCDLPVIAFSARSDTQEEAIRLGASEFMTKPIKTLEMIGRIKAVLNQ